MTSKLWLLSALTWLSTNVCYSQELDNKIPTEVLSIVHKYTSQNVDIYLSKKGDLNGDEVTDWAIAAIPLETNNENQVVHFFILIGRKSSTYDVLYHFDNTPLLMSGSHINDVSLDGGKLSISSYGRTCCVIESVEQVFELRNGQLMLIRSLRDIFYMPNEDGSENRPRKHIEIDYLSKIKTSRIESEIDESKNKTTITSIQAGRLKSIDEYYPF